MIASHEIPNGSRLYFGKIAQQKREIESIASTVLNDSGYEEIITPSFTYTQYQDIDNQKDVIRLSGEYNKTLALRADTTLDVVRLITSRLGRSTTHKKWFYIQPIFHYPSSEIYQIGLEEIGSETIVDKLKIMIELFDTYKIKPTIALSNIKIPNLLVEGFDVELEDLKENNFNKLLEHKHSWIRELINISNKEDLSDAIKIVPDVIKPHLIELQTAWSSISYDNIVIAPLYYASMKYYEGMFFRAFDGNNVLAKGGVYKDSGVTSSGFAIYTDNLLEEIL
jgi:ATP phosphoribosyltransferase regulatory subunit HisZ